jgi:hypothetical protein
MILPSFKWISSSTAFMVEESPGKFGAYDHYLLKNHVLDRCSSLEERQRARV